MSLERICFPFDIIQGSLINGYKTVRIGSVSVQSHSNPVWFWFNVRQVDLVPGSNLLKSVWLRFGRPTGTEATRNRH